MVKSRVFWGIVIPPLIGILIIYPYYWVDDHPLLYGNNGSLDPGTYDLVNFTIPYTRKKPPDPETVAQDLDIQVPHTETEVNGV